LHLPTTRLLDALPIAHDAIEEGSVWAAWNFDPEFIIPVVLAALVYANGLRRWSDRTRAHPWWRVAFYYSGLIVLLLSIESPIDRLGEHHFSMHMIQHELVIMGAVPLILLGAPTTPMLRGMPRWLRLGVVRPLAKRREVRAGYRGLTHPAVAVAVLAAVFWLWHLAPGWYDTALEDDLVHDLQHLSFSFAGVLLWWNIIDPKPLRARLGYIPRVLFVFAAGVPKHFLGAILTFAEEPLYDAYLAVDPILSLDRLEDQQLGGLIMWVPSVMMHLVTMGIVFAIWAQKSEQRQREEEAAREAAAAGD
jgi:putative membrane protein